MYGTLQSTPQERQDTICTVRQNISHERQADLNHGCCSTTAPQAADLCERSVAVQSPDIQEGLQLTTKNQD